MSSERRVLPYILPTTTRFRGLSQREGLLIEGSMGWGDFCPFPEYSDTEAVPWLQAALCAADEPWPQMRRSQVPVNAIIPVVSAQRARELVRGAGASTVKVKVADTADSLTQDIERIEAIRDELGPQGHIRLDANAAWDLDTAVRWIRDLQAAAQGVQYVEQPCAEVANLARVRERTGVAIAADESLRRSPNPFDVDLADAVDVAILKCSPLGGVRRSLQLAEHLRERWGLPCVVSSAIESSVGLSQSVVLAAALPELPFACGLDTRRLLGADVAATELQVRAERGSIAVPQRPVVPDLHSWEEQGFLGMSPMPNERLHWWQERLSRVIELLPNS